jgi:hypothetical protein
MQIDGKSARANYVKEYDTRTWYQVTKFDCDEWQSRDRLASNAGAGVRPSLPIPYAMKYKGNKMSGGGNNEV